MIRTSKHTLSFCSKDKQDNIKRLISDYKSFALDIFNYYWNNIDLDNPQYPKFADSKTLHLFNNNLTERLKQCCAKQVLSMIDSSLGKRRKQIFMLNNLKEEKKDYKHLEDKIKKDIITKPDVSNINVELDSRFIDFNFDQKSFVCFVRLSCLNKNKTIIKIPIGKSRVYDKWNNKGKLLKSIRLSEKYINLYFNVKEEEKKTVGDIVGCDQGIKDLITLSDKQKVDLYQGRYDLTHINKVLSRKKKGSKSFGRAQEFRKNYINWYLNQINFSKIKELRLEKLRNVGKGKRKSRFLSHWTYRDINTKLYRLSEEKGFQIREVDNKFRSQRCSKCGYVNKRNRKLKIFKCLNCSYKDDSDFNASVNISLDLYDLPKWIFLKKINLEGFLWKPEGVFSLDQERLVPDDNKR